MAVLTLDTATHIAAVSVSVDHSPLASVTSLVPRGHSRVVQPMIHSALQMASLKPADLSHIVVGVGPGSYTGVRLGVATAKAMAAALNLPVTPVSTLFAMAEAAVPGSSSRSPEVYVLPQLYARRGRAFGALYRKADGKWECVVKDQVNEVAAWVDVLRTTIPSNTSVVVVHDFEQPKQRHLLEIVERGPVPVYKVRLTDVAGDIGPALFRLYRHYALPQVSGSDIHAIVPDYALPVEAETKLAERSERPNEHR